MKHFLFVTTGLLLCALTHAFPFEAQNAEPVTWYTLPSGLQPQDQTRMVDSDGMRYPVGRINQNKDAVLNVEEDDNFNRALIHRYNLASGTSESLGPQDGYCMRAISVATLQTGVNKYDDVVAGIRSRFSKKGYCDDRFTPVIWSGDRWSELDVTAFKLEDGLIAAPYGFAKQNPQWLLGKVIDFNNYQHLASFVVVWRYDAKTGQYKSFKRLPVKDGFALNKIADFPDDARKIVLEVSGKENDIYFTQEYILTGNNYTSAIPETYQNIPVGFYAFENATLVLNLLENYGTKINATEQLSPSTKPLFYFPEFPDFPSFPNTIHGNKGMIILNPITGYGAGPGGDAMIYQEGVSYDQSESAAFIPVQNYLARYCAIINSFSQCEIGYLKITDISGNTAMGECWDSDGGSNTGFYIADIAGCPDARPSGFMKPGW